LEVGFRKYTTQASADAAESKKAFANSAPEQPAVITVDKVNDLTPEYEHLRQFLPAVVIEEEMATVVQRVQKVKSTGKKPSIADSLWLVLANLRKNNLESATVAWNDLLSQTMPDILHWNLMLVHAGQARNAKLVEDLYENFKLAVIKRRLPGPVPVTYNVVLKSFAERGDLAIVMEVYEDFFANGWIPELHHLYSVTKAAALAGEPKAFTRFMSRLEHKGVEINRETLKAFIDIWGRSQLSGDSLKKHNVSTGDYASVISFSLRVHNYRRAYDLIHDCRDIVGIQPDARMYETVLSALIRDGYLREPARALKKRFHKYPKGIEVREEHYEFNALFDKAIEMMGKNANNAPILDLGEKIKFARTTRKRSRRLFSASPRTRYVSGYEQDEFEWVPEYVQRKKEMALAQEQAAKAEELREIMDKAKKQATSL
jgi:pentatricopeptide repeat protein